MQIYKTFFKKEIFAEFALPRRSLANGRTKADGSKVVIICDGAPSVPSKRLLMEFFCKKGYWVFHIRYRGTWESKGVFLKKSLEQDLLDVLDELPKGFSDFWIKKTYKIIPNKIVLFGTSFGGPAVLLASQDERVDKVIAVSPVVDWRRDGKAERMREWIPFMRKAYGMAYRGSHWQKLLDGKFYNPLAHNKDINGRKIFIIHAKDDDIVPFRPVGQFANKTKSTLVVYKKGGHLRSSVIMKPALWKRISKFLKTRGKLEL